MPRAGTKLGDAIELLFDEGSFVEDEPAQDSSCVVGAGLVDGRKCWLVADAPHAEVPQDFATLHGKKMRLLERVHADPHPVILLADAFRLFRPAGMFIATPGFPELLFGKVGATAYLRELARLSGVVPTVALAIGDLFGGGTLNAPLCDTYVLVEGRRITFSRPDLYKKMTGDAEGSERLGNAAMHCSTSGLGDALVPSCADGIAWVKSYVSYFPASFRALPPRSLERGRTAKESDTFAIEASIPFDVRRLIDVFVDDDSFLEHKAGYAREVVTGFARIEGRVVGLVANNSKVKSGAIFPDTCKKVVRFVSLCDSFSIPLVFLADTPGFMVGVGLDEMGAVKLASSVCAQLARTSVPKSLVIVRNAFGGGLFMTGPGFMDSVVTFPNAKVGPFGAVTMRPPETELEARAIADMASMNDMRQMQERGLIDGIVEPSTLRSHLIAFLREHRQMPPAYPRSVLCL